MDFSIPATPSKYTEKPDLDDIPQTPPQAPSPSLVPTATDFLAACIYPLTLIAGSLFSTLSPSDASSTSYFSKKHNILNVVFVKNGWFWTTFVFIVHIIRLRSSSRPKALLRYGLATLWWIAVTQWFFGPPIMDRTFIITGGTCEAVATDPTVRESMGAATLAATSAACKVAGGSWKGGHDLSGHTFLLTHASLFLWSELMPILTFGGWGGWETGGVLGLLAIWWWMLLMTGVYFHTWREQLTGWIASLVEWSLLYVWALRTQPDLRTALGVPGV